MDHEARLIWLIKEAVKSNPERVAIIDGDRKTTCGELMDMAMQVATFIATQKLQPHTFICLKFPLCTEFFAAEIGVWLSGNIAVPIIDSFPEERISQISRHCDSPLTLSTDMFKENAGKPTDASQFAMPQDTDDALLIYTSGSTGAPKGILHDFQSLNNAFCLYEDFNPTAADRFAYGAPINFISQLQYYLFVYGVEVHLLNSQTVRDVKSLAQYYTDHAITMTTISPAVLSIFKNTDKHLRCVWTGSENVAGIGPQDFRLYNLYGSTETGGPMCYAEITEPSDNPSAGKPVAGIEYKIIDEEICFKGHFCKGYFKDEERTHELYKDGWLHMGDLGRLLPNGDIQYINRKDWMVKINGQRVEPGEVEAAMKRIEGIDDAVVKGFPNGRGSHYLVGFYTGSKYFDSNDLQVLLAKTMPRYMVPLIYEHLAAMPLNTNGKKDRTALVPSEAPPTITDYAAPNTENEQILCETFQEILGISHIGIDDDFINLGGDSIKIMKLQLMLPDMNLTYDIILQHRTARKIAAHIQAYQPIINNPLDKKYPLTQTQLGIYAECMKREDEPVYNVTNISKLSKRLDTARLRNAVVSAIKAHPALFVRITNDEDGNPWMTYMEPGSDTNLCPTLTTDEDGLQAIISEMRKPFHLDSEPLIRCKIVETEQNQYLCVSTHHIIFDGLSRQALYEDINTAYCHGSVEAEKVTCFDIAAREEAQRKDNKALQKAHDWYMKEFGDVEGITVPAPDKTTNGNTTFGEYHHYLTITSDEFMALCKRLNTSPTAMMYTIFGRLLSVYTGKKDVTFASIWHGRHDSDTLRSMMMMVKTLPIRCKYDSNTTIASLAQQMKQQVTDARANDIYSFAEFSNETGITSDVLFAYHGQIRGIPTIDGTELTLLNIGENETGEQLAISVMLEDEKIHLQTEYHSNKYSDDFISRFNDSFDAVINHIAKANASDKVIDISIISSSQEAELKRFRQVATMELPIKTFHQGIERWAELKPDTKAVIAHDRTLTFKEYNETANRLARALKTRGVEQGDRLVLLLPRTSHFLISLFAVMKCGAAYIPMDPAYPADRISYILNDSDGRFVITTTDHAADYADRAIVIDELMEESKNYDGSNLNIDVSPHDLAYLIYTSGSTGKPKGVMLEHLGVANYLTYHPFNICTLPAIKYASVILCQTTVSFDLSIFEYGTPLFNGNTVVFANEEEAINPVAQFELCQRTGVECLSGTPSRLAMNMELSDYEKLMRNQIKTVMMGGEKLPWAVVERMKSMDIIIVNGYGPTETTMGSSAGLMNDATYVHIGKPQANYSYRILDNDRNELPVGVMGELVIGGLSLARGYNKLPEKTADVFIQWHGERIYRTGDYARWTNEGNVIILGRTDNQVKLNGLRIELGEIETVMAKQPNVKQCVVVIKKINGQDKLIAYYTASDGTTPSVDNIKAGMAEHLTHYMVPSIFVQLDKLPITPAGKVDVKNLPEPKMQTEAVVPPANEQEQHLFDMIAELLGANNFGVTTNLLSAGLTSLLAIRLSILIKKKTGHALKVSDIMAKPTIREILAEINLSQTAETTNQNPQSQEQANTVIRPNTPFPLTFAQQGVYFDCLKNPDATTYNMPMLLHIPSKVSAEQLHDAAIKVLGLHPALFSRIVNFDDDPVMLYPKSTAIDIQIKELTSQAFAAFKTTAVQPFSLEHGPLCRATVIKSDNDLYLFLDTHHLVSDGSSMAIIYQQLSDILNGKDIEGESCSYFQFADSQHEYTTRPEYMDTVEFYDEMMKNYEISTMIPSDFQSDKLGEQNELSLPLDNIYNDFENRLDSFCKAGGFTHAQFWYAAISYVLGCYTNTDDVYMCGISSGRQNLDIADTVGMFVNTLALHSHIDNQSIREFVISASKTFTKAMEHENYPFSMIAANYGFQPMFNYVYQLGLMSQFTVGGEAITIEGLETKQPKFPVSVSIEYVGSKPSILIMYDNSLYKEDTMREFADTLLSAATKMIQDPDSSIRNAIAITPKKGFTYKPKKAVNHEKTRQNSLVGKETAANLTEQLFCNIFKGILNVENVGVTDSFFDLGGTSLVAVRVVIEAEKHGLRIDYKSLFDHPTPRELAEMVNTTSGPSLKAESKPDDKPATSTPKTAEGQGETIVDSSDKELYDYDYTAINRLLAAGTLDHFRREGLPMKIGQGVVVTGATGYLGLHIIKELIDLKSQPNIYCLVRPNKAQSSRSRLRTMLFYYFNDSFDHLIDKRIFIIDGDVTQPQAFDQLPTEGITHLFNCAANVKHFSAGTDIEDVNIGGTRNCIRYCMKNHITLIHTSTYSIAGTTESNHPVQSHDLTETQLYWGQTLDNQYTRAKFLAERYVLQAASSGQLQAKILRLGNLSARSEDGEFQVNFSSNAFMGRLRAYHTVGYVPYEAMLGTMEFSPIDEVAKTVILLSETPRENVVFHPVNPNRQLFAGAINCLNRMGINIQLAEQDKFQQALVTAASSPEKAEMLQSMLAYQSVADGKYVVFNGCDNTLTTQLLMRLGFQWSFTTWDYMEQFITAIRGLGFFD